jgi:hypothetical protein
VTESLVSSWDRELEVWMMVLASSTGPSAWRIITGSLGATTWAVAVCLAAACGTNTAHSQLDQWAAQVDTVGDTIVVRTISGSERGVATLVPETQIGAVDGLEHEILGSVGGIAVDPEGNIYVYDRQVPVLRKYGPDGHFVMNLGRRGNGPGEYSKSDGGLAALQDGRIVLRDPGNGRLIVYGPDGQYVDSWPARGGTYTSNPMIPSNDGGFFNPVFGGGLPTRLVRHAPDGTPSDTLPPPVRGIRMPTVTASTPDGSSQTYLVPFTPSAIWAFSPGGYYISVITDRYAIDLFRMDGSVLRFEMELQPIPVSQGERAAEEERIARLMRNLDPSWRWNGPPIPATKPLIRAVYAGDDGRVWVRLHQPAEQVPFHGSQASDGPSPIPIFREPTVLDVFEEDGRYLGRVTSPFDIAFAPQPVFRGDTVWAVTRDDLEVEYVVRFRVAFE